MGQTYPSTAGRSYLVIPGPSVVPDVVLNAMHRASPNIYAGELHDMMPGLVDGLRQVARTKGHVAIYIGNGHAAWEAALSNVIAPGDKVIAPVTGLFGRGWADVAEGVGAEVEIIDFGNRKPMEPARVAEALAADKAHKIKAVIAVHVDTSSSVQNDLAAIRTVMDDLGHPALLMADCIASMGCDRFEMDKWGVDIAVAAGQKGLMLPPGLSFVFFNDRAAQRRAAMPRVSRYWDWAPRANPDDFHRYFAGTAPTHHLYGLRAALGLIHDEGLEAVWARHQMLARAIWAACDQWAQGGSLEMNVSDPAHRSNAVTALRFAQPDATRLRDWTETHLGLTLGIGIGMADSDDPAWHRFFRLGHMGHVNGHMIMGALGGIEAGMKALNIPHGDGALAAASQVIAEG